MRRSLLPIFLVFGLCGCSPIAESFNQKGADAFRRKDLAEAKKQFNRAVLLGGSNPTYHNNLGYVLYMLKDYDGAEKEFQKALTDHPSESLLRQIQVDQVLLYCDANAAVAESSHKDWINKGIGILQELLRKDPNNAELHMRLGFAYFRAANPGGGFFELDQAVVLATPQQIAPYTSNPVEGALFILRQVEQFYIKVRLFKKATVLEKKIQKIEKNISPKS